MLGFAAVGTMWRTPALPFELYTCEELRAMYAEATGALDPVRERRSALVELLGAIERAGAPVRRVPRLVVESMPSVERGVMLRGMDDSGSQVFGRTTAASSRDGCVKFRVFDQTEVAPGRMRVESTLGGKIHQAFLKPRSSPLYVFAAAGGEHDTWVLSAYRNGMKHDSMVLYRWDGGAPGYVYDK